MRPFFLIRIPGPLILIDEAIPHPRTECGLFRSSVFVRGPRPAPKPDPVGRFETKPGEQMQIDWATIGRGAEQLSVLIVTLGWSRTSYVEFWEDSVPRIDTEDWQSKSLDLGPQPRRCRPSPQADPHRTGSL
jgi:hypothetical protein